MEDVEDQRGRGSDVDSAERTVGYAVAEKGGNRPRRPSLLVYRSGSAGRAVEHGFVEGAEPELEIDEAVDFLGQRCPPVNDRASGEAPAGLIGIAVDDVVTHR